MIKHWYLPLTAMFLLPHAGFAQATPGFYHLREIIQLAVSNAPELKVSNSELRESQLALALVQEQFKPQVFLNATLPNLSRSIQSRPLPDGRDAYVNTSTMYNGVGMEARYQLEGTGGFIYAQSSLDRLDILKTAQLPYSRNYFFKPISLGFSQPLFQFNEVRWQKQQSALRNRELTAQQYVIREEVIQSAIIKYSTAFQAQLQLELISQKLTETDTLLQIKQRLFDIGKTTKVEMLRLELEASSNRQRLEQARVDWESARLDLSDYLDLDHDALQGLHPPPPEDYVEIVPERALDLALKNAYLLANFNSRLRTAEAGLEMAVKDRGVLFDINASLGLNNSDPNLERILTGMEDRQTVSLGITVPITGGKSRSLKRDIAEEQLSRELTNIELDKRELIRTVLQDVATYQLLHKNIDLNKQTMDVAGEVLELTRRQYLAGSLGFTELNVVTGERDQALLEYYRSILEAGLKYHQIRRNCLYDFKTGTTLAPVE